MGDKEESFSMGFKDPQLSDGQGVRFVAKENAKGYFNGDIKTLEKITIKTAAVSQNVHNAIVGTDARQRSIVWQSSYKAAIDQARAALELGYAGLGDKAKQADKLDFFINLCHEFCMRIYSTALNPPEPLVFEEAEEEDFSPETDDDYKPV